MNYNSDNTIAFTIETGGRDINGNTVRHLTFFKRQGDTWVMYKKARTNEYLGNADADTIVRIWG